MLMQLLRMSSSLCITHSYKWSRSLLFDLYLVQVFFHPAKSFQTWKKDCMSFHSSLFLCLLWMHYRNSRYIRLRLVCTLCEERGHVWTYPCYTYVFFTPALKLYRFFKPLTKCLGRQSGWVAPALPEACKLKTNGAAYAQHRHAWNA